MKSVEVSLAYDIADSFIAAQVVKHLARDLEQRLEESDRDYHDLEEVIPGTDITFEDLKVLFIEITRL